MHILSIGFVIGALLGLLHAAYVYRVVTSTAPASVGPQRGFYYAMWTFVLWALFGSYVMILWCLSVVLFSASRLLGKWN